MRSLEMTICLLAPCKRVEGVEELLLQTFLALHELDVVDEQDVDLAVAALEAGRRVGSDRVDVLVEEGLGADVAHDVVLVVAMHVVTDRVQQMGLAEAGRAIDEQRVVAAARCFGDARGSRERELVRLTLDEGVERVARVESGEIGGDWPRPVASSATRTSRGVPPRRTARSPATSCWLASKPSISSSRASSPPSLTCTSTTKKRFEAPISSNASRTKGR